MLTRSAAIVLFAVVAGQFAVAGHAAAADHGVGEQCEVCVTGERLTYGLAQAAAVALAPAAQPAASARLPELYPRSLLRHRHARGPPSV
ncbi:MAG: hypothetical protein GVY21_02960 [Gammaproteobacteria bacterium]|jgi:hypothetical protein|nr:hypothetical protein [Gammaproteobacteria bacterium]